MITAIIIAKSISERVPNKNFREFYQGHSLVDIAILETIDAGINPRNIWLSSDSSEAKAWADLHGINFHLEEISSHGNRVPMCQVFEHVTSRVPGDVVLWRQVVDPMFALNEGTKTCLNHWHEYCAGSEQVDSLVMCYERRDYYLDANFSPVGFQFGEWQPPSVNLPPMYVIPFTLSILKRETINRVRTMVGTSPYWLPFNHRTVDIDTPQDFKAAQLLYAHGKDLPILRRERIETLPDVTGELDLTQWGNPKGEPIGKSGPFKVFR